MLTHRVMRFLIDEHGFRSLALEGDPLTILARARPFLRLAQILAAVRWIRARNERNPNDLVRIMHVVEQPREAEGQLAGSEDVEQRVAQITITRHEQTGDRIVYWGGLAHTLLEA